MSIKEVRAYHRLPANGGSLKKEPSKVWWILFEKKRKLPDYAMLDWDYPCAFFKTRKEARQYIVKGYHTVKKITIE